MAEGQRHLWIGDWQRHQPQDADTVQILPEPAPEATAAPQPARAAAAARTRERKARAWTIAGVLGSAAFAWSFGYIIGEVHSNTDPGLARAAGADSAIQQQPSQGGFQVTPDPSQQQVPDPSAGQDQGGGLPPVTTRQS